MRFGFLVSACVLILVASFSGCQKTQSLNVDYGPEASEAAVNNALATPLQGMDETSMRKGDMVLMDHEQYIADNPEEITDDSEYDVFDRQQDANNVYPSILLTQNYYSATGTIQQVIKHFELDICTQNCPPDDSSSSPDPSQPTIVTTFHNLQVSQPYLMPAPQDVQNRPNCLGIPNCQIHVTKVTVDEVETEGNASQKFTHEYLLTPDTPYFGNVLQHCISTTEVIEYEGKANPLSVKDCDTVIDWVYGQANPASSPTTGTTSVPPSPPQSFVDPVRKALMSVFSLSPMN